MNRRYSRKKTVVEETANEDKMAQAMDRIGAVTHQALVSVAGAVGPALADARDKIGPAVEDARDKIGPVVEDARDKLIPVVEDARDKMAPLAASAALTTKAQGHKAALKLGIVEEPQPPSHRIRNLLVVLGLGGIAAFAYQKLTGKDADPAWTASRDTAAASQSATTTSPASTVNGTGLAASEAAADPTGGDTTVPGDQSDTAPTAPFATEETVESHVPTTPDEPLEKREL